MLKWPLDSLNFESLIFMVFYLDLLFDIKSENSFKMACSNEIFVSMIIITET